MRLSKIAGVAIAAVLLLIGQLAMAQQRTIRGTVVDQNGQPVVGAAIIEAGTTNGTVADIDGNFSLSLSSNNLTISFIGYVTQNLDITGQNSVSVTLKEDNVELDDVVVVGYGQMKRSDMTGSVVSVGDDAIKKSVVTSVDQVLQGRAAGVSIQANSGQPGASTSIRIRGTNSLNATNQPIFVIDGVVIDASTSDENSNPLSSINPSDIVSMDVLKDASATAIYGSRASNGVIMITTKKGKSGESTITYDGYAGWQEMPVQLDMLNLREYAEHHNARSDAGTGAEANSSFVRPDLLGKGTNWQDELFRKAVMQSHNLSITGGSEKTTYALSGGDLDQEGIAEGSSFKRVSFRGNIDSEVKKFLRAGANFNFSESKQELGTNNDVIMQALMQQPTVAVTSPDGSFDGPDDVWMPLNPIGLAKLKTNYNKKINFRFGAYLEADIISGLKLKSEVSADYNFNRDYYYCPDYKFGVLTQDIRTSEWTKTNTRYWSWRNTLTYDKTFADRHNLNVMVGQEMNHSNYEYQFASANGFSSNTTPDISAGDASTSSAKGFKNDNSISSVFGRVFFSYDDRYLLTATIRRDGSSKFADDNRWGWFPSAALAWKVANEEFFPEQDVLTNAKLRLGWGQTGNQNVSDWAYMSILSYKTTPWGTGVLTGNTANPDLEWETTDSYNLGLDLSFFANRIELIADTYYKKTRNLLLQLPLPAFLGSEGWGAASNPWGNVGSLENKGLELTLNTVNIDKGGFTWRTNLVFSLNRNKVKELDSASSTIDKTYQVGSSKYTVTRTVEGQPIGQFWGYKVIGRFDKPEDFYYTDKDGKVKQVALPEGNTIGKNSTFIGDFRFADINGDGKINNEDCTFIGNPEPKFTYGIGNTFSYKGFDLSVFFSGSYGNDALDFTRSRIEDPRVNSNILKDALDYARVEMIDPDGSDTDYRNFHVVGGDKHMAALQASDANNNYTRVSDLFVEDASYIRLQNISLSYTFPRSWKWMEAARLSNVRVYANVQNVYTWTKYKGLDPEIGAMYGDALMTGFDYGRYPSPRIFTFGLSASF